MIPIFDFQYIDVLSIYLVNIGSSFQRQKRNYNTNAFQKMLYESDRKINKIWVDKGSEFDNTSIKSSLQDYDIEMYSAHNEGKYVVAEKFIRALKNKIYKYMTSISKNVYTNKLDHIVNEYNNTYHSTTKMKPVDVKSSTYIDFNVQNNNKDPNLKLVTM